MSVMGNDERFEELCAGYVLDALDAQERTAFEAALAAAIPEQRRVFAQLQQLAHHLPASVDQVEPAAYLRERILASVRAHRAVAPAPGFLDRLAEVLGLAVPKAAVLVVGVLLIGIVGIAVYSVSLRTVNLSLQQAAVQKDRRLVALQGELAQQQALLDVLAAKTVELVAMKGLEVNPNGYGKVIWDPARRSAILQVSNLPTIPSDKDYQFWEIRDKVPISAGLFTIRQTGQQAFFRIDNLPETNKQAINAFAITLEPAGGVPQPTGAMYLLGSPL